VHGSEAVINSRVIHRHSTAHRSRDRNDREREAQLSQRSRAMLCVIGYFAKSFEITHGH